MIKRIYIVFLAAFSLLMGPMQFAAAKSVEVETACCEKQASAGHCDDSKCDDQGKGCEGDCDCVGCTCVVHLSHSPLFFFQQASSSVISFVEKEHIFFFQDKFHPSVYRSIWLPPKIG